MEDRKRNGACRTRSSVALAAMSLVAGCTTMSAQDCRGVDWYQLGYRDGDVYGLRPRIDQYAYQCRAAGVDVQENSYLAGWVDGYREWASRVMPNESP
jgi:hypothetical protein